MSDRLTILSVGRARVGWPRDVARWATAGLLPVDHHPCLGPDELDARLAEAGGVDVVLVDGGLAAAGRDLIHGAARQAGAVLVVDHEDRGWTAMGATAVAPPPDGPETLRRVLEGLAIPRRPDPATPTLTADAQPPRPAGRLVTVVGHGGAGTSTVAAGLAARWAAPQAGPGDGRDVLLADLSLGADQHVHHDVIDPGPGVVELMTDGGDDDGRRSTGAPRDLTRSLPHGPRLLTGLRHPRDWTLLGPAAVRAALDSLRATFEIVVADADEDIDGRAETGSGDLEERNALTRVAVTTADAVVVVARGDLLGVHRLCRHLAALHAAAVDPTRLAVVVNGSRRRAPSATTVRREVTDLLGRPPGDGPFVALPHLRGLEARRRDGRPPGRRLGRALAPLDRLLAPDPGDEPDHPHGRGDRRLGRTTTGAVR